MKKLLILFIFCVVYKIGYCQSSMLSGKIMDAESNALVGATVKLAPANRRTVTDSNGVFVFQQVPNGRYKVEISFVGMEQKRVPIAIENGEAVHLNMIVLNESVNSLSEVTILAGSKKYVETAPSVGLRLNAPLIEVPQNIAVTTKQTMLNWGILSTSELARTVSGVVKRYGETNDFSFTIRGTDAYNNIFRNGVGGYWWNQQEDAAMIERIEFVKGPAGFMIGNSEPGGLVNIITKQPIQQQLKEIEIGIGSFNMYRASIDLGGRLTNKSKFSYRVAAGGQLQKGMVQFSDAKRYFISPSLRYNFKEKTYLQLEVNRMGGFSRNGTSPTLPSINNEFFKLSNSFSVSDPSIRGLVTYDNYSRLSFVHQLKNNWRINSQVAYINGLYGGDGMYMSNYNAAQDTIYRGYFKSDWKNYLNAGQIFVDGTIRQGKHAEHKILTGIDYGRSWVKTNYGNLIDSTGTRLALSVNNPQYGLPADSLKDIEYIDPSNWGNQWISFYVQDHLKLFDKIVLTLAGRMNYAKSWASYDSNTVRDVVLTPRLGFTYLFTKNISAFAVYDESYLPQTGRKEDNTAAKPLTGTNKEIGFKTLLFKNKLSFNISMYHTVKNNILVENPNTSLYVERGQITTDGVDADLVGNLSKNMVINANYTFTNARITKDANEALIGIRNFGTPIHSGNILLRYRITDGKYKGLSFGAGGSFMGDRGGTFPQWNDAKDNGKTTPAYTIYDMNVGYEKRKFSIVVNVFNLFNKKYISTGSYTSANDTSPGYWSYTPGLPVNFRAGVHYKL